MSIENERTRASRLTSYLGAIGLSTALLLAAAGPGARAQSGFETCAPTPIDFVESFDNTTYKDHAASMVDGWGTGMIQLNPKGADFGLPPAGDFPSWINSAAAADFDGDGWPDFVGTSSSYSGASKRILVLIRNQGFNYAHHLAGGISDPAYDASKNWGVGNFAIYANRNNNQSGAYKDYIELWADSGCIQSEDQDAINPAGFPYGCDGSSHTTIVAGDFDGLGNLDVNRDGTIQDGHSPYGYDPANLDTNDYKPSFDFIYLSANGGDDVSGTKLHTAYMFLNRQTTAQRGSVLDPDFSNDLQPSFERIDLSQNSRIKNYSNISGIAWSATALSAVDLEGDGDLDVVMGNNKGEVWFWQSDRSTKTPTTFVFTASKLFASGFSFRGASTVKAADIDNDGDLDLIVGSVSGANLQVWLNDGNERFTKRNTTFVDLSKTFTISYNVACTTPSSCLCTQTASVKSFRGAATVLVLDDFDADGDQDILVSSDNWNYQSGGLLGAYTYLFPNDGNGNFPLSLERILFTPRCLRNGNCDGDCNDGLPTDDLVQDMDLGDKLDYDLDGDHDIMTADGNHSEAYFLFKNDKAAYFNIYGVAQSISVDTVEDINQTIVAVKFDHLDEALYSTIGSGTFGPLSEGKDVFVTYEVTADGGKNWEPLADNELPCNNIRSSHCSTNSTSHQFTHFGSDLRWRATLVAADDNASGQSGTSYQTPRVLQIDLTYDVVDCRQYTRTSISVNIANQSDPSAPASEIIVGASFEFPSFRGHLYAFDTSNLKTFDAADPTSRITSVAEFACSDPSSSDPLQRAGIAFLNDNGTVDPSDDVTLFWDAVEHLQAQISTDSRRIFTARSTASSDPVEANQLVPFTVANADNLNDADYMGKYLTDESLFYHLAVPDSEVVNLIRFVSRQGTDPTQIPTLGDIDHSSPVLVASGASSTYAPHLAVDYRQNSKGQGSGPAYSDFLSSITERLPIVVVGANDGMVHAFALTDGTCTFGNLAVDYQGGDEVWAFVPRNLVPKLKSTRQMNQDGTSFSYDRLPMVDSTPAIADAFIDTNGDAAKEWHTVAVFGQGPGTSTGELNYYFALDLTDTCTPQPLWEWSDAIDTSDGDLGAANPPEVGQTWSVPFLAQALDQAAGDHWYAFLGSGYDENETDSNFKGDAFFALDLASGHMAYKSHAVDLDDAADIPNSIPGSPNGVDLDLDGRVDRLYYADLEGRVVRLDVHEPASAAVSEDDIIDAATVSGDGSGWEPCVKVNLTSNDDANRLPTPIFVKPAISLEKKVDSDGNFFNLARIYFGTGGDDRAPADQIYAFYALKDEDPIGGDCSLIDTSSSDSYVFSAADTQPIQLVDDLGNPSGERVWADPLILTQACAGGGGQAEAILFTSLVGSIENTNPCINADSSGSPFPGRLFGRFIKNECRGASAVRAGETGFLDDQGRRNVEYLETASKARGLGGLGQQRTYQKQGSSKKTRGRVFYFSQYAGSGTGGSSAGGTHDSAAWFEWGVELGLAPRIRSFQEVY